MSTLLEQAKATTLPDQTKDDGGFQRQPPSKGLRPARLVGYIELGKREQPDYAGKAKPPVMIARLVFELMGKDDVIEHDDGTRSRKTISEHIAVKTGDRANFVKLLKKMAGGREVTHMAHLLGEGFIVKVEHNEVEKDGAKKTYANIRNKTEGWLVSPPVMNTVDDNGEEVTRKIKVPEAMHPIQLLLWDAPTKEQWDSIFIDGEREVKDPDGKTRTVSNNWIQHSVINESTNFEGSALEEIVQNGAELDLSGGEPGDDLSGQAHVLERDFPDLDADTAEDDLNSLFADMDDK